jgi:hypothetical protein
MKKGKRKRIKKKKMERKIIKNEYGAWQGRK